MTLEEIKKLKRRKMIYNFLQVAVIVGLCVTVYFLPEDELEKGIIAFAIMMLIQGVKE